MKKKLLFISIILNINSVNFSIPELRANKHDFSVAVIIPCYHGHFKFLENLLNEYTKQTKLPDQIVISISEADKNLFIRILEMTKDPVQRETEMINLGKSYSELEKEDVVKEFIQRNGRTIVLCAGGSKKNEFRLLSKFLKLDDIIMAHDYAPNENYFNQHINNKIWNWLEIQDSDINESCEQYNLIPYMEEELRNVVWVCKIKQ
jgi:cellulose synthase/poly-beta-1,6-N-acetylglucosamine synthase-like glycosyltransferase